MCKQKFEFFNYVRSKILTVNWQFSNLMTSAAHRFRSVEFWITGLIFSTVLECRKNNKYSIFKIQNSKFKIRYSKLVSYQGNKTWAQFLIFQKWIIHIADMQKSLDLPQQFPNEILNFGSLCLCKTLHNWQNKPGEKLRTPIDHSPQIWQNIFIQKTIRWWTVMSLEKRVSFIR